MKLYINEITESNSYRLWTTDGDINIIIKKLSDVAEYIRTAPVARIVTDEVTRSLLHTVYGVY